MGSVEDDDLTKLNNDEWMTTAQLKAMFHISNMALWRWQDSDELGFPKPIKIMKRNYWRKSEIDAFNARMVREAIARRKQPKTA